MWAYSFISFLVIEITKGCFVKFEIEGHLMFIYNEPLGSLKISICNALS